MTATAEQLARLRLLETRRLYVRRIEFATHDEIPGLLAELDAAGRLDAGGCVFCVPVAVTPEAWEQRTRAQQVALARDERTPVAEGQGAALRGVTRSSGQSTPADTPKERN